MTRLSLVFRRLRRAVFGPANVDEALLAVHRALDHVQRFADHRGDDAAVYYRQAMVLQTQASELEAFAHTLTDEAGTAADIVARVAFVLGAPK